MKRVEPLQMPEEKAGPASVPGPFRGGKYYTNKNQNLKLAFSMYWRPVTYSFDTCVLLPR